MAAVNMTEGAIPRRLIGYAVPLVLSNLFQLTYNAVDSMVVGRFVGKEALAAVRYLRSHADELGIIPDKIAVGGYSAGGMTAQMAMTRYTGPEDRPDAALLLYGAFARTTRVFWTDYDAQAYREAAQLDPIRNIRPDCPPTFIFQTQEDDPRNALLFALELAQRGIPHEVHTFTEGRHGGAIYDGTYDTPDIPHTAHWVTLAYEWLEANQF